MVYVFDEFELDLQRFELRRGGIPAKVEPQVFDLLSLLIERRDRVVSRDEILQSVWADRFISESTLASRLAAARKVIDDTARDQRLIRTVHGRGYRFVGEVRELAAPRPVMPATPTPVALVAPASDPLLGRQEELSQLQRACDAACQGQRQVAFVTGDAGLGKTALVEAFLADGTPKDTRITSGQCLEHSGAGEAYMPVLEALGRLCSADESGGLVELLLRRAPTWMVQMPWLLTDEQMDAVERRTKGARTDRMLREMGEALETVSADRPLVMVLEDLHWSDPSTIDLVAWIAARTEPCRLLLLVTYRPEGLAAGGRRLAAVHQRLRLRGQCLDINVPSLTESSVRGYLELRFPQGDLPARLAPTVLRRTDGNPLFMVNLVEAWIEEGLVASSADGSWTIQADVDELTRRVPETLRQLIELRLGDLDESARTALQSASVAGKTFSAAAVAAASEESVESVERTLSGLAEARHFLRARGTIEWPDGTIAAGFEFTHSLYQDVVYDRIGAAQRARIHVRIGDRLAVAFAGRTGERAAELALHYDRGRDPRRAAEFYHQAALRALDRSAYPEAIDHLERALELTTGLPSVPETSALELELRVLYAPTLAALEGWGKQEVETAFREAHQLCLELEDEEQLFPILYGLAGLHELRGEFDACQRVLDETGRHSDWPRLEFHEMMACSVFHQGWYEKALDHTERALEAFDPTRQDLYARAYGESAVVRTYIWAALILWFKGFPDQAVERMQLALEVSEGPDLIYSLSNARSQMACLYQFRREPQLARRYAHDTIEVASRHGFGYREAMGMMIEGWVAATTDGLTERGVSIIREALERSERLGVLLDRPYFLGLLAEAQLAGNRAEDGLQSVSEALEFIRTTRRYFYEPELHRLRGDLLLVDGEREDEATAETCYARAIEVARQHGARSLELRATVSLGRHWIGTGRRTEAVRLVEEALASFDEGANTPDQRDAAQLIAAS